MLLQQLARITCKPVRLFHVKMAPGYPLSASNSSWIIVFYLIKTGNSADDLTQKPLNKSNRHQSHQSQVCDAERKYQFMNANDANTSTSTVTMVTEKRPSQDSDLCILVS